MEHTKYEVVPFKVLSGVSRSCGFCEKEESFAEGDTMFGLMRVDAEPEEKVTLICKVCIDKRLLKC